MSYPPFAYYGGKTRLADRIVALLPAHEHYIEPFAGSLAVLLAKTPSRMETVNDLDGLLMTFWRVLRDQPEQLARACALTPHSRAEYESARDADLSAVTDDVERARLIWVQIAAGRGGTPGGGNGYRVDMTEHADHVELLWALMECRASVVVSAYPSELYSEALKGWDCLEIPHSTGQGNGVNQARTEVLWFNRPIVAQRSLFEVAR